MKKTLKNIIPLSVFVAGVMLSSCEKFVDLGAPPTQVLYGEAFATDPSAQSVVLGIYVGATGNINNQNMSNMTTFFSGLSADDLQYNAADALTLEFASNSILNTNNSVANLWNNLYQTVKNANNAIAGLEASSTLTPSTKDQLIGEAKFMRAYAYLYLVNLYGEVPLPLKSDYEFRDNAMLSRSSVEVVYGQIVDDLKDAEAKLDVAYKGVVTARGRANKHSASALLARVYLYLKDYPNAEMYASKVLTASGYGMPAPAASFLNNSNEVIFQLANIQGNTTFGVNYVTAPTVVPQYSLPDAIYPSFDASDLRRANWLAPKAISGKTYYAITKYKVAGNTGSEYHVVLRLAEQYLIRAEARANMTNAGDVNSELLSGARADINAVRARAGLGEVGSTLTKDQMLTAIETERLHELFGEYGHRWLDLKRTGRATAVLSPIKPNWQETDVLFPIPESQRLINNELTQNLGYEN